MTTLLLYRFCRRGDAAEAAASFEAPDGSFVRLNRSIEPIPACEMRGLIWG